MAITTDERPLRPIDPKGVVHLANPVDFRGSTMCGRYIGATWLSGAREVDCQPCLEMEAQHGD